MAQPPSIYGDVAHVGRLPEPGNTAAPIAQGVDALAGAVAGAVQSGQQTNLEVARIQRERSLQLATGDTAAKLADMQGQLSVDLIGLRQQAAPGAIGYEDQVGQRLDKFREDATAMLGTDPQLQSRFVDNIASIAANARTEETKWAMVQRATKSVTDSTDLQNALQSNIRTAVAGGTFNEQLLHDADAVDTTAIRSLPIGGTAQDKMLKDRHDERLVTLIDARTDSDPHAVLADIDAGKYGELDDKVVNQLRNRARVMADHLDVQARQQSDATLGIQRAQAENLVGDVHKGTVADMATLQSYRAIVAASPKPEDIKLTHDIDLAIAENAVNSKYDTAAPQDRVAAMAEIEGHKDWRDNPQLVVAHSQLETLISRDKEASDKDPLTLYQRQTGQVVPPLNLHDPAAMSHRFILADQAAQRFGKPVPMAFTQQESEQLKQQYNSATVDGKAAFIEQLGAFGSERARQMMFQIAPDKPSLVRLAELGASPDPAVRGLVQEAADGSAVPMKDGVAAAVKTMAQRTYGAALSRMPGDRQQAILQVATWIYAHRAAAAGKANVLDPALQEQSIQAALGGAAGKGGIGARNGAPVVLPMGATQDDLDRVFAMGTPQDFRAASNGVPKWGTMNRDLTVGEFKNLVPVLINDTGSQTLYSFRSTGGSGYVKNDRGQDYVLDIRKLSAALQARMHSSIAAGNLGRYGYKRY